MIKIKIKKEDWKKIGWFVMIGIISAIGYILLSESLHEIIPRGTLFGLPFDYADLIIVIIFIFGSVIIYLFFKQNKQEFDKKRRLK